MLVRRLRPRDHDLSRIARLCVPGLLHVEGREVRLVWSPVSGLATIDAAMALVEVGRLPGEAYITTDPVGYQWRGRAFDGGTESHAVGFGV